MLGGTLFTMTVSENEHKQLTSVFSDELAKKYEAIVNERRNYYLQGLVLGMVFSSVLLITRKGEMTRSHSIFLFFAVTLFTAMMYYLLMPKSDYMLNYLTTAEQNRAWLKMYKTMQTRYLLGILIGALASIPIANSWCGLVKKPE